jgi:alpha-ketoglutarate-dependent taurine dioxygenase
VVDYFGIADTRPTWHTNLSYPTTPPRGSLLYAVEVPTNEHRKALGTTFFVSTAAYDAPPRPGNSRYSAKVLNDVSRPVSSPKQSRPCPTSSTR